VSGLGEILEENSRLREMLQARETQLTAQTEQFMAQLAVQTEQIEALKASNEQFARHFEFLQKQRELARNERFIAAELQSPLFEGLDVAAPPRDPERDAASTEENSDPSGSSTGSGGKPDRRKTAGHPRKGRRDVSALSFPRQTVTAPLNASSCERCGGVREPIEPRLSHRVGWVPGHHVVVEVVQQRCQCPSCEKAEVWIAPEPCLLPGAMCDDTLLARVVVDKFGAHLPLNRQADRMTREGFEIGENVLSGWVRAGATAVRLLVTAVKEQIASAQTLLGDDTGYPVQDGTDGKLTKGRLWVFTDQKQAFYEFSRTKEGEHPTAVLSALGFTRRRLVVDGGSEYNDAERTLHLSRGGCLAHLRRYFKNAALQHPEAIGPLATLQDLFLIEREIADLAPDARLEVRQRRSAPLVEGLYTWVKAMGAKVRPGSKLGEAVGYAVSQESRMRLFLAHGDVPSHNNLSELLLRQPVVGRKNWMFSGSQGGASAAACWFTLIASSRLQNIDPRLYLTDVFGRLPDYSSKWVHELTPLNWRLSVEAGDIVPTSRGGSR
jgi:transposase